MSAVLVDICCGAGGMTKGFQRAGFYVIGVDVNPQPNYCGDVFIRADALRFLDDLLSTEGWVGDNPVHRVVAAHASPPCQSYLNLGKVNRALGRDYEHPDLIGEVRERLLKLDVPYVIENVEDASAELRDPARLCGSSFGLPIRRHRLFEANFPLSVPPCNHAWQAVPRYWTGWRPNGEHRLSNVVQVYGNGGGRSEWPEALGIDWMTPKELTEAIPPAYAEFIGRQMIRFVELAQHAEASPPADPAVAQAERDYEAALAHPRAEGLAAAGARLARLYRASREAA